MSNIIDIIKWQNLEKLINNKVNIKGPIVG